MFALVHTDWNSLDPVYIPSQRSPGDRALNNVVIAFKICSFADKPTLAALAGCTRATFFPAVRRLWLHGGPYCANVPGNGDIYDSPWVASRLEEVLGRVTSMERRRVYRQSVKAIHIRGERPWSDFTLYPTRLPNLSSITYYHGRHNLAIDLTRDLIGRVISAQCNIDEGTIEDQIDSAESARRAWAPIVSELRSAFESYWDDFTIGITGLASGDPVSTHIIEAAAYLDVYIEDYMVIGDVGDPAFTMAIQAALAAPRVISVCITAICSEDDLSHDGVSFRRKDDCMTLLRELAQRGHDILLRLKGHDLGTICDFLFRYRTYISAFNALTIMYSHRGSSGSTTDRGLQPTPHMSSFPSAAIVPTDLSVDIHCCVDYGDGQVALNETPMLFWREEWLRVLARIYIEFASVSRSPGINTILPYRTSITLGYEGIRKALDMIDYIKASFEQHIAMLKREREPPAARHAKERGWCKVSQ